MRNYKSSLNKVYKIPNNPIATGGEARIYEVSNDPNLVAKIYKPGKAAPELEKKLKVMVNHPVNNTGDVAWPVDILYDNSDKFVGFVMQQAKNSTKLRDIYLYNNRKQMWGYYVRIALNLAVAVHNVHEVNQTIGALNPDNILVDKQRGNITLIDTDSYHIRDPESQHLYRCGVGMPEIIAPEIQGVDFSVIDEQKSFNEHTDNFSLAVLIFQLLMNGGHPFGYEVNSTSSKSVSHFLPIDSIKNGLSPYFKREMNVDILGLEIPPYVPEMDGVPDYVRVLFKRAFVDGYTNHDTRPSAQEWITALSRLEHNLKICGKNPQHEYYGGTAECPWCKVDKKVGSATSGNFSSLSSIKLKPTVISLSSPQVDISSSSENPSAKLKKILQSKTMGIVVIIVVAMILVGVVIGVGLQGSSDKNSPFYQPIQTPTPTPTPVLSYWLDIQTTPVGATVKIDGVTWQTVTPLRLICQDSNPHEITITKDGYLPITKTVVMTSDQVISEKLVEGNFGSIKIRSDYPGVAYLNDTYLGNVVGGETTFRNLDPGTYTLRIDSKYGFTKVPDVTIKPHVTIVVAVGFAGKTD